MPKKNYYQILEINQSASALEITSAYRRLVKKYHPDVNLDNIEKSTAEFIKVDTAYDTLKEPELRKRYDESLSNIKSSLGKKKRTRKTNEQNSQTQKKERKARAKHEKDYREEDNTQKGRRSADKKKTSIWLHFGSIYFILSGLVMALGVGFASGIDIVWRLLGGFGFCFFIFAYLMQLGFIRYKETSSFFQNYILRSGSVLVGVFKYPQTYLILIVSFGLYFFISEESQVGIKNEATKLPVMEINTGLINRSKEMNSEEKLQYHSDQRFKN
ncbi:MAG: hypothetical protein CMM25_02205 [Rhodospirillaceae bacterium]|nr:hypothetical protein [Rhodospirillaceae bacterium]